MNSSITYWDSRIPYAVGAYLQEAADNDGSRAVEIFADTNRPGKLLNITVKLFIDAISCSADAIANSDCHTHCELL